MDNNNNTNTKTVVTKKVVTTLGSGMAKPIPINSVDAAAIAKEQEQLQRMAEEQAAMEAQAYAQMNAMNEQSMNNDINMYDNSVAQFNDVNDLVKVVEKKNDGLLIAIMSLILLIIVIIIICQLPMLFNL